MKMDRDTNLDGKGKYAVVRLRGVQIGSEAYGHLKALELAGVLDWGIIGQPDEFFVIKLRDKHALPALEAYAKSASQDDPQYGVAVLKMAERSGMLSPFCKAPD